MWTALTDKLARRGRVLPSDAGLHITVLLDDRITDDELRANTRANGLRVPPLGGSYRFTTPRCGWVVGFGAIATPDIPAAVDALTTALDAATQPPR
jgi:DNA-binding transcriptional MocR family regulator